MLSPNYHDPGLRHETPPTVLSDGAIADRAYPGGLTYIDHSSVHAASLLVRSGLLFAGLHDVDLFNADLFRKLLDDEGG